MMESKHLAVVLIHGIGDIAKRNVLDAAVSVIRENFTNVRVSAPESVSPTQPTEKSQGQANITEVKLGWNEREIRLVEFQWANVIGKIRLYHPLNAIIKLLKVLFELPLLGTVGLKSRSRRIVASAFGVFHQVLVLALMIFMLWVFVAELMRYEEYAEALQPILESEHTVEPGAIPAADWGYQYGVMLTSIYDGDVYRAKIVLQKLLITVLFYCVIVIPVFLLITTAQVLVNSRVTSTASICLGIVLSALLVFLAWLGLLISAIVLFVWILGVVSPGPGDSLPFIALLFFLFVGWMLLKLAAVLANLLRDVVHYLAPGPGGRPQTHQERIRRELEDLLQRLSGDGADRVVLVAHSLGTVIVADMLLKAGEGAEEKLRVPVDLVTAGSPLRRLINRLLPEYMPNPHQLRQNLAENHVYPVKRWFNAYRLFDYVGQALTYSALLPGLFIRKRKKGDPESSIQEHLLKPGYFWPYGHANYWGDARFLNFLVNKVIVTVLRE